MTHLKVKVNKKWKRREMENALNKTRNKFENIFYLDLNSS